MREIQKPLPGMDRVEHFLRPNSVQGFIDRNRIQDKQRATEQSLDAYINLLRDKVHKDYMRREGENMEVELRRVKALFETIPTDMINTTELRLQTHKAVGGKVLAAQFGSVFQHDGETLNFGLILAACRLGTGDDLDASTMGACDFATYRERYADSEAHLPDRRYQPFADLNGVPSVALPKPHMLARQQYAIPVLAGMELMRQKYFEYTDTYYVQAMISNMEGKGQVVGSALIQDLDTIARPWGNLAIGAQDIMDTDEWQVSAGLAGTQERILQLIESGIVDRRDDYHFVRDVLNMVDAGTMALAPPNGSELLLDDKTTETAWERAHTMKNGLTTSYGGWDGFLYREALKNFGILDRPAR